MHTIFMRFYIHLPEELGYQIERTAKVTQKTKAEIVRHALEKGLKFTHHRKSQSAKALLKLAEMAKKLKGIGPKDLSINHDYYTWGGKKKFKV